MKKIKNQRAEIVAKVILDAIYSDKERKKTMKSAALTLANLILTRLDTYDTEQKEIADNYIV